MKQGTEESALCQVPCVNDMGLLDHWIAFHRGDEAQTGAGSQEAKAKTAVEEAKASQKAKTAVEETKASPQEAKADVCTNSIVVAQQKQLSPHFQCTHGGGPVGNANQLCRNDNDMFPSTVAVNILEVKYVALDYPTVDPLHCPFCPSQKDIGIIARKVGALLECGWKCLYRIINSILNV